MWGLGAAPENLIHQSSSIEMEKLINLKQEEKNIYLVLYLLYCQCRVENIRVPSFYLPSLPA